MFYPCYSKQLLSYGFLWYKFVVNYVKYSQISNDKCQIYSLQKLSYLIINAGSAIKYNKNERMRIEVKHISFLYLEFVEIVRVYKYVHISIFIVLSFDTVLTKIIHTDHII